MRILATLSILALLFLAACSAEKSSSDSAATTDDHAGADHSHDTETASHDHATASDDAMVLVGTVGCGHCTYQVGDGCSAAIKTAEGDIYILDVEEDAEVFNDRYSGAEISVEGTVDSSGDTPIVAVASVTKN